MSVKRSVSPETPSAKKLKIDGNLSRPTELTKGARWMVDQIERMQEHYKVREAPQDAVSPIQNLRQPLIWPQEALFAAVSIIQHQTYSKRL